MNPNRELGMPSGQFAPSLIRWGGTLMRASLLVLMLAVPFSAKTNDHNHPLWDFSIERKKPLRTRPFLSAQFFLLGQIRLYQLLLSEQQPDACNFSPSCSHYAYAAIKKKGSLEGTLMAIDRLQRCNPWAWNYQGTYYAVTWKPGRGYKLLDPP